MAFAASVLTSLPKRMQADLYTVKVVKSVSFWEIGSGDIVTSPTSTEYVWLKSASLTTL